MQQIRFRIRIRRILNMKSASVLRHIPTLKPDQTLHSYMEWKFNVKEPVCSQTSIYS